MVLIALSQRDGAHFVESGGAQRMRTQRIAFLAIAARTGQASPGWQTELDATVRDLLRVRRELFIRRSPFPTVYNVAGDNVVAFADAARAIERNPKDRAAFAYINANRRTLLDTLDTNVKDEAQRLDTRNRKLVAGLIVGSACILAMMALTWIRILAPRERLTMKLIDRLDTTNQRLRSLLANNSGGTSANDETQINVALELVLDAFGMQFAYVGECDGPSIRIKHAVGQNLLELGAVIDLKATYVRQTLELADVVTIDDLSSVEQARDGVPLYPGWHGYISAPLVVAGRQYGAIGFLSTQVVAFNELDRDYIRLVALLVSSAIERRIQNDRLDQLAFYDVVTGLSNRAKLMNDLAAAICLEQRHKRPFALHYIDLDGFKSVNDRFGHGAGDLALKEVGRRLCAAARPYDVPARLGGDEFVVLQAEVNDVSDAIALGSRIVAMLAQPYVLRSENVDLSASIGIAIFPGHGDDAEALLHSADVALYRAKANGKNRFEIARNADRLFISSRAG